MDVNLHWVTKVTIGTRVIDKDFEVLQLHVTSGFNHDHQRTDEIRIYSTHTNVVPPITMTEGERWPTILNRLTVSDTIMAEHVAMKKALEDVAMDSTDENAREIARAALGALA